MTRPWATHPRLTFKVMSTEYNTTPCPQPPVNLGGLRQPTGAQEWDADRPDQGEKGAHDPPGLLMPPHKKKCDRSNFIHFFWLTENKSEHLSGKAAQRKVS